METLAESYPVRRVVPRIEIEGVEVTRELSPHLLGVTYRDALDALADTVEVRLEDAGQEWSGSWFPSGGEALSVALDVFDPAVGPEPVELACGAFEVDEVEVSAPPHVAVVRGTSAAVSVELRRTERSQKWENVRIDVPLREIANRHGLALQVRSDGALPALERVEQQRSSDLAFATRLCHDAGLFIRVSDGALWVGTRAALVAEADQVDVPAWTATGWRFVQRTYARYRACEARYHDPKKKRLVVRTVKAAGVSAGEVLRVNRRAKTAAEADRIARAALAEANREGETGEVSLPGRPDLVSGLVARLDGYGGGRFDRNWLIAEAEHAYTRTGYTTTLRLEPVPADAGPKP